MGLDLRFTPFTNSSVTAQWTSKVKTQGTTPAMYAQHPRRVIDPEEAEMQRQIDSETDANTEFNAAKLSANLRPRSLSAEKVGRPPKSGSKEKAKQRATADQARRSRRRAAGLDSDTTQGEESSDEYVTGYGKTKPVQGMFGSAGSKRAHKPSASTSLPNMPPHPYASPANPSQNGYSYAAYAPGAGPPPLGASHPYYGAPPGSANPYAPQVSPYASNQQAPQATPSSYFDPRAPTSAGYPSLFASTNPGKPSTHASQLGGGGRDHPAVAAARKKLDKNPLPGLPGQASGANPMPSARAGAPPAQAYALPGGYGPSHAMPTREKSKSKGGHVKSSSTGTLPAQPNVYPPNQPYVRPTKTSDPPVPSKPTRGRGRTGERERGQRERSQSRNRPGWDTAESLLGREGIINSGPTTNTFNGIPVVNAGPQLERIPSRTKWGNRIAGLFGRTRKGSTASQDVHYPPPSASFPPTSGPGRYPEPTSAPPTKSGFRGLSFDRLRRPSQSQPQPHPRPSHEFQTSRTSHEAHLPPPGQVPVGIRVDRHGRVVESPEKDKDKKPRVMGFKLGRNNGNEEVEGPIRIDARRPSFDSARRPSFDGLGRPMDGRRPSFDGMGRPMMDARRPSLDGPDAYGPAPRQRSASNTSGPPPPLFGTIGSNVPGHGHPEFGRDYGRDHHAGGSKDPYSSGSKDPYSSIKDRYSSKDHGPKDAYHKDPFGLHPDAHKSPGMGPPPLASMRSPMKRPSWDGRDLVSPHTPTDLPTMTMPSPHPTGMPPPLAGMGPPPLGGMPPPLGGMPPPPTMGGMPPPPTLGPLPGDMPPPLGGMLSPGMPPLGNVDPRSPHAYSMLSPRPPPPDMLSPRVPGRSPGRMEDILATPQVQPHRYEAAGATPYLRDATVPKSPHAPSIATTIPRTLPRPRTMDSAMTDSPTTTPSPDVTEADITRAAQHREAFEWAEQDARERVAAGDNSAPYIFNGFPTWVNWDLFTRLENAERKQHNMGPLPRVTSATQPEALQDIYDEWHETRDKWVDRFWDPEWSKFMHEHGAPIQQQLAAERQTPAGRALEAARVYQRENSELPLAKREFAFGYLWDDGYRHHDWRWIKDGPWKWTVEHENDERRAAGRAPLPRYRPGMSVDDWRDVRDVWHTTASKWAEKRKDLEWLERDRREGITRERRKQLEQQFVKSRQQHKVIRKASGQRSREALRPEERDKLRHEEAMEAIARGRAQAAQGAFQVSEADQRAAQQTLDELMRTPAPTHARPASTVGHGSVRRGGSSIGHRSQPGEPWGDDSDSYESSSTDDLPPAIVHPYGRNHMGFPPPPTTEPPMPDWIRQKKTSDPPGSSMGSMPLRNPSVPSVGKPKKPGILKGILKRTFSTQRKNSANAPGRSNSQKQNGDYAGMPGHGHSRSEVSPVDNPWAGAIRNHHPVSVQPIRFDRNHPFSMTSPHALEYEGKLYPSAIHLWHALRFLKRPARRGRGRNVEEDWHPELAEGIRQAAEPELHADQWAHAGAIGKDGTIMRSLQRPDWEEVQMEKMDEVLALKFTQYPSLGKMLMSTHPATLLYMWDGPWGAGADLKGPNNLGKAIMRCRDRLMQYHGR